MERLDVFVTHKLKWSNRDGLQVNHLFEWKHRLFKVGTGPTTLLLPKTNLQRHKTKMSCSVDAHSDAVIYQHTNLRIAAELSGLIALRF